MTEKAMWVDKDLIDQVKFDEKGLIPGIVQDARSGEVLMVAWLNRESLEKTLETGNATFWSRSRQTLWMKGETSGNLLKVKRICLDCDADTLLLESEATGPACHTGERTCFFRLLARREGEG